MTEHRPFVKRIRGRQLQAIRRGHLAEFPLCAYCLLMGRCAAATQVDHVKPLDQGGLDEASNRQSLCRPCHKAKSIAEAGKRALKTDVNASGVPIEPAHHWNQPAGSSAKTGGGVEKNHEYIFGNRARARKESPQIATRGISVGR